MADLSKLSDDDLLAAVGGASKPAATATPAAFAKQYGGLAQAVGQKLGVDPSLVLGQLGLETGWGKSVIPGTNNLGNIKDFSGSGTAARDNMTGSNDRYRQYATPDAFAADYASLLQRKYPGVVGAGADANRFIGGLRGYAEDPAYGQKLAGSIATVRKASPSLLARVGDAAASAISGTANAATPADLSKLSDDDLIAALSARIGAKPAEKPSAEASKLKGSVLGGAWMGLRDAVDAGAQLARRAVPDSVGQAVDKFGNALADLGLPVARSNGVEGVDAIVNNANKTYDDSRKMAGRDGVDVARIAGNVANPVNRLIPMAGPMSVGATALRAGAQGLISGVATPVVGQDAQSNFAGTKAGQAVLGSATGAAGGAAVQKLVSGAERIVSSIRSTLPSVRGAAAIDSNDVLVRAAADAGVDLSAIPTSIQEGVRKDVANALSSGKTLDAKALLRKAEGEAVLGPENGLTLGQATREPMQYAREKNMSGVALGADGQNALAQRFANQNAGLIDALNQRGATQAAGKFNAGQGVMNALQRVDAAAQERIGGLYGQAKAINGGDIPLDAESFVSTARDTLAREMRDLHLPSSVSSQLERFASGKTPLNVGTAEQFKSILAQDVANAQARGQGNVVNALGIVRDALENTRPLMGGEADQGAAAISAFNQARAAARARFGEIDSNPALRAVVNGNAVPDNFFQKYVIGGDVGDLTALLRIVPDQGAALRAQVVDHLKQKALNGASDEVGKFSQSSFNKAINELGDAKLSALFDPADVAALKQIGRVAANIQAHPAGAVVNTSGTGAAVMNLLNKMGGGKVASLPGVNLLANSVKQFQQERAAGNALAARVPANANPAPINALRSLFPYTAGAFGSFGAQMGQ